MALLPLLPAAQTIAGRVTDRNAAAVPYAYIYIEGTNSGTQADEEGHFCLKTPKDGTYTLTAACAGFEKTRKEAATGDTAVRIAMQGNNLLETVTVTGTRTPKTLANTPVVTKIISQRDIELSDATNVKDLLETQMPGLEFTYSMNQQVAVSLQGMGGMSILMLVDGERLAGETLDNTDFARLSTDNVERIEIIKGAATALYGSNAVGAVINIITKNSTEPWSLQLNGRLGSRSNQYRHSIGTGLCRGRWNNMLNIQTDGADSHTLRDSSGDTTRVYGNRQWNLKDKLAFRINARSRLTARGGYYFHERDDSPEHKDRARDFSGGLRYENTMDGGRQLDISYAFDRYDKSSFYPHTEKDFLDYRNVQNTLRALYTRHFAECLRISLGGDAMNDYLMSYQFSASHHHHSQQTADLFAQADWDISPRWNVVGGLRADYFSEYGTEVTPKAAALYRLGNAKFRGSYSKGFRAPTLKEMYMDFNMANIFTIHGNEDLKSEISHCFSLSAEYGKEKYNLALTGYLNVIDNEITTVWDPARDRNGAMVYRNIDGTNTASLDAAFMSHLSNGLSLKLGYTYFHEFPRSGMPATSDARPHSAVAQLCYHKALRGYDLTVLLNGRWLSAASYSVLNSTYDGYVPYTSEGYTMWKLTTIHRFRNAFSLTLAVDNLLNYKPRTYAYNSPYTQGITFYLGTGIDVQRLAGWKKQ